MYLNDENTWEEVGSYDPATNKPSKTGAYIRDCFKNGTAQKRLLDTSLKLYKFNHGDQLTRPDSNKVSPWWSPYDAWEWDAGWEERKKLAAQLKVNIRELGRVTSAIKENWNSLSYLLVIQVQKGAYGYFGGFAQMTRLDVDKASKRDPKIEASGGTKNLPGGGTQFYIPDLTTNDVLLVSVESLG